MALHANISCTTSNDSQAPELGNPLTTPEPLATNLATMGKKPRKPHSASVVPVYSGRQGRRPHYLAELMERHGVTRADLIERLEVDKSLLSRWLDENKPSTPSPDWAAKLNTYFGAGGDPVDIFADPDVDWLARLLRNRSPEEIGQLRAVVEAFFGSKRR